MTRYLLDANHVDAVIASAALRYNLILLTTDSDFKEIPHLRLENWA